MERLALSPREAARLLGCNKSHIYAAVKEGALVARSVGAHSLIESDALMTWFRSLPATKPKGEPHE
jgi:excisionase family DNA binding protein